MPQNFMLSKWFALLLLTLIAGACLAFFFYGCSRSMNTSEGVNARQQTVQDCILSGRHPRLGPGNTILCE